MLESRYRGRHRGHPGAHPSRRAQVRSGRARARRRSRSSGAWRRWSTPPAGLGRRPRSWALRPRRPAVPRDREGPVPASSAPVPARAPGRARRARGRGAALLRPTLLRVQPPAAARVERPLLRALPPLPHPALSAHRGVSGRRGGFEPRVISRRRCAASSSAVSSRSTRATSASSARSARDARRTALLIGIGTREESYTAENPFTAGERFEMIDRALREAHVTGVEIVPVADIRRHALWVRYLEGLLPPFREVYTNNPLTRLLFEKAGYPVESPGPDRARPARGRQDPRGARDGRPLARPPSGRGRPLPRRDRRAGAARALRRRPRHRPARPERP